MSIYMGRGIEDYSAMQGPCASGFHVPLTTEWQAVYNVWTALGGGSRDGANFGIALKLPFAGFRDYYNYSGSVIKQGIEGYYWSSSRSSTYSIAYHLYFVKSSSPLSPQNTNDCSFGFSVRCFKDTPVVPTSSWAKLYGTSIEAGGIFWSSTDGLISMSSDGQTWITIQDKNLGATTVWNSGNTLSEANCGKYYQWGNNYGFPRTGSITTSSSQVNAKNYGPGNYYSNSTFITTNPRDSSNNKNLRGGVTGVVYISNIKDIYVGGGRIEDYSAMQGPCASGFHIPSKNEWVSLVKILTNTFGLANNGNTLKTYLKMPFAGGRINTTSNVSGQGSNGTYWASTGSAGFGNLVYILPNYLDTNSNFRTSNGYSIRPFRNSPVTPDSSRTVLYQGTGIAGIYHNSSLGLISISGDGSTWKTISNKNLGATTVYNDGNTLSQNNCGKYYQWGNGYGFAFSGSVTTSSSTVNASAYGPGNYYGNYIFRTVSGGWDSSNNANLRGGTTKKGGVDVYIGTTKVWTAQN